MKICKHLLTIIYRIYLELVPKSLLDAPLAAQVRIHHQNLQPLNLVAAPPVAQGHGTINLPQHAFIISNKMVMVAMDEFLITLLCRQLNLLCPGGQLLRPDIGGRAFQRMRLDAVLCPVILQIQGFQRIQLIFLHKGS